MHSRWLFPQVRCDGSLFFFFLTLSLESAMTCLCSIPCDSEFCLQIHSIFEPRVPRQPLQTKCIDIYIYIYTFLKGMRRCLYPTYRLFMDLLTMLAKDSQCWSSPTIVIDFWEILQALLILFSVHLATFLMLSFCTGVYSL